MALTTGDGFPTRRRFTDDTDRFETVIGPGVELEGEVRGATNLELLGTVVGNVEIEGLFWLRPGGKMEGELKATDVVVEGEMVGDISASRKVDLRISAQVMGDVSARIIAAAEGSFFEGKVSMAAGNEHCEMVTYREKRGDGRSSENGSE